MPNYCDNKIILSGSKDFLKTFKEKFCQEDGMIDFNKIIPLDNKDDFEEKIEKWSTKWYADYEVIEWCNNSIQFNFQTAWNPPYKVIEKLGKLLKDYKEFNFLTYQGFEPGLEIKAFYNINNSEKFEDMKIVSSWDLEDEDKEEV